MSQFDSGMFLNYFLGAMSNRINVPEDFHAQAEAVREIMDNDITGLVDSLTDFSVNSASVEFGIETTNENLTSLLKRWLEVVNIDYLGKITPGIGAVANQYFKERWKYASFPILKIAKWEAVNGIILPTKMFFVDGGSVYAKAKTQSSVQTILDYNYTLGEGKDALDLNKNAIITNPYGRWADQYPIPFIIKRGVYFNWKLIQTLKNNQSKVLNQIIPYMLLVQKGTEKLATENIKIYSDPELKKVLSDIQTMMQDFQQSNNASKTMARATQFDEEIKHLIPDLTTLFSSALFETLEKHVLSGLGFLDIADTTNTSKRDSILNPKAFTEEVRAGVKDFKNQILKPLFYMIREKNLEGSRTMKNVTANITSSPVNGFMTDEFKKQVMRLWRAGRLSDQTSVEMIAEVEFTTEVQRRKNEKKEGIPTIMYPPVSENREDPTKKTPTGDSDINENDIPTDKTDPVESQEFVEASDKTEVDINESSLVGAPYKTAKALPDSITEKMTLDLQRVFMRVFNKAFKHYKDDKLATKVAWFAVKRISELDENGIWNRKQVKEADGKTTDTLLTGKIIKLAFASVLKENNKNRNALIQELTEEKEN